MVIGQVGMALKEGKFRINVRRKFFSEGQVGLRH